MHVTSSVNNCNEHLNIIDTLTHQHYEEGCPFKNTIFTNILSHFKNTCTFALNKPATLKSSHTLSKKKCKNRPHRTHTNTHTHTHTHTAELLFLFLKTNHTITVLWKVLTIPSHHNSLREWSARTDTFYGCFNYPLRSTFKASDLWC